MRLPPRVLIFLSVLLLTLGTTGAAVMSLFQPQIQRFSTERIFAAREIHNLSGSREYDTEVVQDVVFTIEAGLSFFHTHGEGMGVVLLFAATAVASLVGRRRVRGLLHWLLGLSFLFPLGYLAYSALILAYGKDAGIAFAEWALLIPFGSSAILGLGLLAAAAGLLLINGRFRRTSTAPRDPGAVARPMAEDLPGWRRPPRLVVLAAALLIAVAEMSGASMARFKPEITVFATARIVERPQVHGLVGSRDVDNEILDEALVKLDGGLRLFHLHGEGMGLVIFAVALVISTLVRGARMRTLLHALVTLGGFGFPFGYLLWSALIPFYGVSPARTLSVWLVLVPFGALVLLALWALTVYLARDLARGGWRSDGGPPPRGAGVPTPGGGASTAGRAHTRSVGSAATGPARPSSEMLLPPLAVILASMLLLVIAEAGGGAMVKFRVTFDRANRERVEARPQIHGLVGVREVDGPVVDNLLARADFALRLFHLHGEGMALVIFAGGLMVRAFLTSPLLSRGLNVMLAVGGFVYPFGYLAWSAMIPVLGLERSKEVAEYLIWIPFGGAALVAMVMISLGLARGLAGSQRERSGHA